jgi:tetratricopeptide (TPR) repeat protein
MQKPTNTPSTDSTEPKQGQVLLAQGRDHYVQAQYQEALSCLHLAYDACLAQEQAEPTTEGMAAEIANDIGVVYTVQKRWDEAEKWLGEAQQRFGQAGDLEGEAQALGNVGSMYRARGDYQQAAAHLQLSADRFRVVGDHERRAASLRTLSVVRLRQFRPLQAVTAYRAALACNPNPNFVIKLLLKLFDLPFVLYHS